MAATKITMTVNGTELVFHPTMETYNKYVNEVTPTKKTSAANNFLMRIVDPKSKEALRDMIKTQPGALIELLGTVIDEYHGDFNIEVKK